MIMDTPIIRLDPRKEKLARFLATGKTQTYAAEQLQVSKQTINTWVKEDLVQQRIEQLRVDVAKQADDLLLDSVVEAAETVRRIAIGDVHEDSKMVSAQLKAALYILDRAKTAKIPAVRDNYKMKNIEPLSGMDDEEKDEILERFE